MAYRLLDTNIVSFLMKSHPLAAGYRPHLVGFDPAVSFQTVAEPIDGGVRANWGDARWSELNATLSTMVVLHSTELTCHLWAAARALRRAQPVAVADCWIAATAMEHRLELVTHNPRDFVGIPGLVVITEVP